MRNTSNHPVLSGFFAFCCFYHLCPAFRCRTISLSWFFSFSVDRILSPPHPSVASFSFSLWDPSHNPSSSHLPSFFPPSNQSLPSSVSPTFRDFFPYRFFSLRSPFSALWELRSPFLRKIRNIPFLLPEFSLFSPSSLLLPSFTLYTRFPSFFGHSSFPPFPPSFCFSLSSSIFC